jgi:hypothetical protein
MPETDQDEIVKKVVPFVLDASVLDMQETHNIVREDIKQNRIEYVFPEGINQVDLFDECRALTRLDDFENMYDFTMSALHGKPVEINIINYDGSKTLLCAFQITDRYMDLRGVDAIDVYPYLVTWLTEFMGAHISKKYPQPMRSQLPAQAAEKKGSEKN